VAGLTADVQAAVTPRAVYVPALVSIKVAPVVPLLHKVLGSLLVRVSEDPAQIVRFPLGVTVGIAGVAFTTTVTGVLTADVQPWLIVRAEKIPDDVTEIVWLVAFVFQTTFGTEACKSTDPPEQKIVEP
jgi:hypothetical protein